jgi:hypothetical protein
MGTGLATGPLTVTVNGMDWPSVTYVGALRVRVGIAWKVTTAAEEVDAE